jgi:hypothetical protein
MVGRWHLDLVALGLVVGLVVVVLDRWLAPHLPGWSAAAGAVVAAAVVSGGDHPVPMRVVQFAVAGLAVTLLAGRRRIGAVAVTGLLLAALHESGLGLDRWPTGFSTAATIAVGVVGLLGLAPAPRTDADTESTVEPARVRRADAIAGFGLALCLWAATPDTDTPALLAAALVPAALRDVVGRRWDAPDPLALGVVLIGAASGFGGRPAGTALLPVVALAAVALTAWCPRTAHRPRWIETGALLVIGTVTAVAARTAGLTADPSVAARWALGTGLVLAALAAAGAVRRIRDGGAVQNRPS